MFYRFPNILSSFSRLGCCIFRNNSGLESYWDYTSASAGRAGTGYINNFTGNLVWIHDTIGFGGNRMPVSITHVYNANDRGNNMFALGYGWRTNFHQRVYQWAQDSDYYVWEDADGTKHYFLYDSANTYLDEDGLELTLTTNGSDTQKYCITDKYGNKSFFDTNGRLTKQQNNQATVSSITVTYTTATGPLISTITDGAGRVYVFGYETDEDVGVTYLSYIRYTSKGTTAITQTNFYYELNTSGNCVLISIEDADEQWCGFSYNSSNLLTQAQDVADYKIVYEYNTTTANKPSRVSKVCEYDGTVQGGELNIEYAHNQTTFTDHNGNVEIMQFNDFGNTVSIQDDEGHAQYAQYAFNTADEAQNNTDATKKGNQLRLSSKLQNTVGNRLRDGNFESGATWVSNSTALTLSRTTDTAYIGYNSLKLVSSTEDTVAAYISGFPVAPGETYTFSAYVKTESAYAMIALQYSGDYTTYMGSHLSQNKDWTRMQVSYTNTTNATRNITPLLFLSTSGTAYMDCVQVEKAATPSRYNLVSNGDFRHSGSPAYDWSTVGLTSADAITTLGSSAAPELDSNVMKITGNPTGCKQMMTCVQSAGSAGDSFVLSGWAKGDSVPLESLGEEARKFGMLATFNYTDGTASETFEVSFNPDADSSVSWQYAAMPFVAKKAYSSITVQLAYDYNANTVFFDGIQLYKEEFGNSYTYDAEGNVTKVTDLQKKETTYEYSANNLTKEILPSGATLHYTYDTWHNVKTATTQEGLVYSFTYDTYGNNTAVSVTADGKTMTSTAVYSTDGNRLVSTTDTLGKTTTYSYNENTNALEWVKYPEDTDATRTHYTYDELYRLSGVSSALDTGKTLGVSYSYYEDRLEEIRMNGDTLYLAYTDFDQIDWIGTDFLTIAGYYYTNDRNRYLEKLDYGNGTSVQYTYDDKGRVITETYEDGDTVTYTYDNDGALAKMTDSATGRTTKYYYDFIGRTMKQTESGTNYSHSVSYGYDEINNLTSMVETINGVTNTTNYAYDDDNRVTSVTSGDLSHAYSYDDFGRLTGEITKFEGSPVVTQTPTYYAPSSTTVSGQVATYQVTSDGYNKTFSYTYDDNGNILSISDGAKTTSYVYDSANQLIRENNQAANKTWTWEYDNGGNILRKKEYAYTTGTLGTPLDTIAYGYDYSEWGQLLSSYDGHEVSYGLDNDFFTSVFYDDKYEYTWEHGHQLKYLYEFIAETYFCEYYFYYDANGMRTKTVKQTSDLDFNKYWSDTYEYTYNGSQLTRMTYDGAGGWWTMDFRYDADGTPISVTFEHVAHEEDWEFGGYLGEETAYDCCAGTYYYITNLQGDVIALVDENGALVGSYTYDAWGRVLSTTGSACIMRHNPLRYRGYVYDTQTRFYYLQSRYYDPAKGRFISPDAIDVLTATPMALTDKNLYAYCDNNPVVRIDHGGQFWESVFDVISLGASIVEVCVNPTDIWAWAGLVGDALDLIPFVTGVGEVTRAVKTIDKVTDTVQIAKAVDFTDDAADIVKTLDRSSGFTKSTASAGRKIHAGYKATDNFSSIGKEYRRISGIRPDYIDFNTRTIYELKPMNPRGVRSGIRQLQKYNKALGGGFNMRLELY